MRENEFQSRLIKTLKTRFPGCIVMKNDPNYIQGIPDLIVLYKSKWAALECKKSAYAPLRPNQQYYVDYMKEDSYAAVIYPENEESILWELCEFFGLIGE